MAYETNPLLALWYALPPNVRQQYTSGLKAAGELSPGAAVRDVVDESGNMVKAAQSGNWVDAAAGPAKMAVAALGVIPGTKAATKAIRAYHGSPHSFDKFDLGKAGSTKDPGALGRAVYASTDDVGVANKYPHRYELEISPVNPLKLSLPNFYTDKQKVVRDALGLPHTATAADVAREAQKRGHDATVLDYSPTGYKHQEIAAYDPKIIEILRKYGMLPATVAAGATGAATVPGLLAPNDKGAY